MKNTIQNLVNEAQKILSSSGVKNSRFESTLITQKTLNKSLLDLFKNPHQCISKIQKKNVLNFISERAKGKPISKIFGVKEFFSNEFIVNQDVLDPRPETELLVEISVKQCIDLRKKSVSILDLGVGSGCLIISILKELSNINFSATGVDFSDKAIMIAKQNVKKFKLEKTLKIKKSNWFSKIDKKFDIIVCNPPYIPTFEINALDKGVKIYDPFISLDGGDSGLKAYKEISKKAKLFLNDFGIILFEIGFGQLNLVKKIFKDEGFKTFLEEKDLQGINRVVGFIL